MCRLSSTFSSSYVFFFQQKTAYEMRISDWSSAVGSSDLRPASLVELLLHGVKRIEQRQAAGVRFDDRSRQRRRYLVLIGEDRRRPVDRREIGRASCRERACQYV